MRHSMMTYTIVDEPEALTGLRVEGFGVAGHHGVPIGAAPACLDLDTLDDNGGSSHGGPGEQATHGADGTALDAPRGGTRDPA